MRPKGKRITILAGCAVACAVAVAAWVCRDRIGVWYRFWKQFESLGNNEHGYPEYRHRQTGIVFVGLPGGTFMMGSPETVKPKEFWEIPVHEVTLTSFMIAKYEVSQAEWISVMSDNPSVFQGENLPVESMYWESCREFCETTGLKLPTEAQWEYACRAGTTTQFAFGETITTDQVDYNGNYPYGDTPKGKYRDETVPVASFKPNAFGLYQMHGNVAEWCEDIWDKNFYSKTEATAANPKCTSGSERRVTRGGGFGGGLGHARYCRSAKRIPIYPSHRRGNLGFRPVWSTQ